MKKVLFVFAHPYRRRSRANRTILEKVRGLPHVTIDDLYEKYPNFHIDVKAEQKLLLEHDVIFFQHPFYWYSIPPMLKLWFDEVLELGFAYGEGGTYLSGKDFWMSFTTGRAEENYLPENNYSFDVESYLPAYKQTAYLCHMNWVPPIVLHGVNRATREQVEAHAEKVKQALLEVTK